MQQRAISIWNIETQRGLSVSGRPCCCSATLTWGISPLYCRSCRALFGKNLKNPSLLHCWMCCNCLLTTRLCAQVQSIKTCIIGEGKNMRGGVSQVSRRHCKEEQAACPSPSMDPAASPPWPHSVSAPASPAERELLHMHRCQYVRTHLLGRSSRV